jgi:hypothetical protein
MTVEALTIQTSDKESMAMKNFARALLQLPIVIDDNGVIMTQPKLY